MFEDLWLAKLKDHIDGFSSIALSETFYMYCTSRFPARLEYLPRPSSTQQTKLTITIFHSTPAIHNYSLPLANHGIHSHGPLLHVSERPERPLPFRHQLHLTQQPHLRIQKQHHQSLHHQPLEHWSSPTPPAREPRRRRYELPGRLGRGSRSKQRGSYG